MIPKTYTAGIFHGKEDIELREVPMPEVGDNDVLVQNLYASLCGSEIGVYQYGLRGERIVPGKDFGHEGVCRAVIVGKNVKDIKPGDRLAPFPRTVLQDNTRIGAWGSYSQYVLFPNCELGKTVLAVPDSVPSDLACMVEPFSVGMRAAKVTNARPGETGVVFGCGTIGMACALWLKHCGANILVVDPHELRLEKAREVGGFETFNPLSGDLNEFLKEKYGVAYKPRGYYSDGQGIKGIDFYVDCAGKSNDTRPDIFRQAQQFAKIGARYIVCGKHSCGPESIDLLLVSQNRMQILGSGGYDWEDMEDVLKLFESKEFDIAKIITHKFEQKDLAKALLEGQQRDECLKIEIKFVDD